MQTKMEIQTEGNRDSGLFDDSMEYDASTDRCRTCANGDYAEGARKFCECGKTVHVFSTCSVPARGSSEGYGQVRICIECKAKLVTLDVDVLSAHVFENRCNQVVLHQENTKVKAKKKEKTK